MKFAIAVLNILLPALYWITVWCYAKAFFKHSALAKRIKTPLLDITIFFHFLYLLARTMLFEHPPITSPFEICSVIAFTMAVSYRAIEYLTRVKNTGYFVLVISFFFQTISSLFIQNFTEVKSVLRSNLLGFHVTSALLGYSAFALSAVYGLLYIMLYHQIKTKQFGVIYENLPDLEKLETMSTISVLSGFILLTIAIVAGVLWLPRAFAQYSLLDAKLVGTAVIWLMYGVGLLAKRTVGWQGRKLMILSMAGFAVSLFSLTVINVFFTGFHNFF